MQGEKEILWLQNEFQVILGAFPKAQGCNYKSGGDKQCFF